MTPSPGTTLDRLASWFRSREDDDSIAPAPDRQASHRIRYEQIGAFLDRHGLEPSTINFDFAGRFLDGADSRLMQVARAVLDKRGSFTDHDVERIMERRAAEDTAGKLEALSRELEAKVAECLHAVGDATDSTSAYSTALDAAATQMASDPGEAYRRLLEVTLEVAETTRKIGGRLERTCKDTRKLRADLERAKRAAEEDELTGLPNRRGFMARVESALARPETRPLTLALCDIDDFKTINDRHGHHTGDRVLRFVAQQLQAALGRHVVVGRHGGEEFVCLFETSTVEEAAELLDGCRQRLRDRALRDQTSGLSIGRISFSAGVAAITSDAAPALRLADELLYAAKHAGKDRVVTVSTAETSAAA
jgi:diguanylate cyclase